MVFIWSASAKFRRFVGKAFSTFTKFADFENGYIESITIAIHIFKSCEIVTILFYRGEMRSFVLNNSNASNL